MRNTWNDHAAGARTRAVVWLVVLLCGLVFAIRDAWVSDDIFITFRYCDNLLAGHGPVYNPGERSEGYTHFLWFLLLTLGRALGIEAQTLGKYAGLPFYAGSLLLLGRLSGRLFPGRGGWWGVPLAMVGWAAHEDARQFASGGLETAAFNFFLLLGFEFACVSERRRRGALAGWALAVATLLRPDGLLYAGLAGAWLFWQRRRVPGAWREYALVWLVLVVPLFIFRILYYGYPFPNPYYAKSGGGANWAQGWIYARLYFGSYFVLLVALLAAVPLAGALMRRRVPASWGDAVPALVFAWVASVLTALYVVRVGGDFMFARFFLPTTPFLLLLLEALVQLLPRAFWRVGATAAVAALLVYGAVRKHSKLQKKHNVAGIVDERQFYPAARFKEVRELSQPLRDCLAGTQATLMVQGGQASLAYYARFPIALERYGLTDETIAHGPIRRRGRPGHEKYPAAEYVYQRGVNLRIDYQPVRNVPQYTLFALPGVNGEIIVYDRPLMEHIKSCRGAVFLDFPIWLAQTYLPNLDRVGPNRLKSDWNNFNLFYFDHNPDPEGLRDKLRAALAARGITDLPERGVPTTNFEDLGRPSGNLPGGGTF